MGKAVLIYAHPNPASYNHAIKETALKALESSGYEVMVRDLYQMKFDPVLSGEDFKAFQSGKPKADVAFEQGLIKEAQLLAFIFPIWWFNMPAVLKGYIDRVFSYGFAYAMDEKTGQLRGLLNDKKVVIINTTGGPQDAYEQHGLKSALDTTIDFGNFGFCGMEVVWHKYIYAVPGKPRSELERLLKQASDELVGILA